jgi:6-phosphogluconolactonase
MTAPASLFIGAYGGVYPLTRESGAWALGAPFEVGRQASYGCYDPWRGVHYLVDEIEVGTVASYVDEEGGWRQRSSVPTGGGCPCFVSIDAEASALVAANYKTGSVAVFRLDGDGSILAGPVVLQDSGSGPIADRQDGPHAHCARFAGSFLYWTDLGADRVLACRYEPVLGVVGEPFDAFVAPSGQGPRHIVFHQTLPRAYMLTELCSRLFVLDVAPDGRLSEVERHATLPAGFTGQSLGGHLALDVDGGRLYASNRGHDSIAVFSLDETGDLSPQQIVPTGGRSPRHFRLLQDANVAIVAHEESDSISVLPLGADGRLGEAVQRIACPKPVFVGCDVLDKAW